MEPLDLRKTFPRSVSQTLGGYVHLARMIDKARAKLAGTIGDYMYPCPLDKRLLEFAGVSADRFAAAVKGKSDEEILRWFVAESRKPTEQEIAAWNQQMLTRGPDTVEKREYFRGVRDKIDPTRADITSWADLLDLEEERYVPKRTTPVR